MSNSSHTRTMRFHIQLGAPQPVGELFTVVPLLLPHVVERRSLTLEEALEQGLAGVSETGVVSAARVTVKGTLPMLVLEGELLVGGFQNRVVNISVLLEPAKPGRSRSVA